MVFFKPTKWKVYITVLFILLDCLISYLFITPRGIDTVLPKEVLVFTPSYIVSSLLYSEIAVLFNYEPPGITDYITGAIGAFIEGYLIACLLVFFATKLKEYRENRKR